MNPDTITEISNILQDLDSFSLNDIIKSQIIDSDEYVEAKINHLKPLYLAYTQALKYKDVDEDDFEEIDTQFINICLNIISCISQKFDFTMDDEWLAYNHSKIPSIAFVLYHFFILDLYYIILESLNTYIVDHLKELVSDFEDYVNSKDVCSVTNMKNLDRDHAIVTTGIFDVLDYTFSLFDNEILLDNINKEYIPGLIIKDLMDDNVLIGDFNHSIANVFKDNLPLRSHIAFDIVYRIKNKGYLEKETFAEFEKIESAPETPHTNTDIEDDVDD